MKCKVNGCKNTVHARGYCNRHYIQKTRRGHIYGNPKRSNRGLNDYRFEGNICIMEICDIKAEKIAETKINLEDFEKVLKLKWGLSKQGYAVYRGGRIKLADFIMNFKSNLKFMVDHINQDKLDNRRENLRIVNRSVNAINSKLRIDSQSGHRGISWDKEKEMWVVHFKSNYIGRARNLFQAIEMRRQAEQDGENSSR